MKITINAVPALVCGLAVAAAAMPALVQTHVVGQDETWTIARTKTLTKLIIGRGGNVAAPDGYAVTMTVNGIEQGQRLATTSGVNTVFVPGTYQGDVVLTVTRANPVTLQAGPNQITFPFDATSGVIGADGAAVTMAVNGTATPIVPGNLYSGQIVLTE